MPVQIGELRARLTAEAQGMKQEIRSTKKDFADLGTQAKKTAADLKVLNDALSKAGLSAEQIKKVAEAMTKPEKGAKASAEAVKKLGEQGDKAAKSVSELREAVKKIGDGKSGIDVAGESMDHLSHSSEEAAKKVKDVDDKVKITGESVDKLGGHSHKAVGSFMDLNMALQDVGANSKQVELINAALRRSHPELLQQQLANVRTELQSLGIGSKEIDDIIDQMERLNKTTSATSAEIDALGVAYAALAVAIAAAIAKAVQTAMQFEQAIQNVRAIIEPTSQDFEELRKTAISLGADTKFSASQAADAMAELGQAGFKTKEIIAAMPGVLSLAATGNVDLATTADIASSILRGFGLQATETSRVVDVLAKSSIDTNANVTDLGMAMKYVAPVAAAMGLSVEEATAAVGELSNAGIKGEQAGTSLRAILLALASPSKEAAFYMDRLGVSIKDSAGNIVPLSNLIGQLTSVWGRLTQAQQADVATTLVGREAASGFIALIEAGTETLDGYTESLQDAGGTAERVAGTQMDTLKGSVDNMTSALESVGITVGDTFLPSVRQAVEGITALLTGFTELDPAAQKSIVTFTTVTPLVLGSVTAFYTLKKAIDAARISMAAMGMSIPVVGQIALVIGAVAAGAAYLAGEYADAKEATKNFEEAQKALNQTLNESPINRTVDELKNLRDKTADLNAVLEERAKLQNQLNDLDSQIKAGENAPEILNQAGEISEKLDEIDRKLRGMGYDGVENATARLNDMNKAINGSVSALFEEQKASVATLATKKQRVESAEAEIATIQKLSAAQKLDQAQKQALINAVNALKREYPDLLAVQEEDGRIRVQNIGTIQDQINADKTMTNNAATNARVRIENLAAEAKAQRASVEAQIQNYSKLLSAMAAVSGARASTFAESVKQGEQRMNGGTPNVMDIVTSTAKAQAAAELKALTEQQVKIADKQREIEKAAASLSSGDFSLGANTKGAPIDLSAPAKVKTSKPKTEKPGKSAAELAAEARKAAYEADLKTVQFQAEYYDLSAEKQIQKYEALRKKHAQFLKESVDDARTLTLQIKRLNEDSVKDRYDFSATVIDQEMKRMEDAGKSEREMANQRLYMWTNVRKKYAEDSEQYKQADEQVRQARKDLAQATIEEERNTYEKRSDLIDKEVRRLEDSGATEVEIAELKVKKWTELRDKYAADSEYYANADEELYKARKELVEKLTDLADDLVDKEKDAIEKAKQADLDAVEDRKDAYVNAQDAKIKAIEDLMAAEEQMNADADYESQLAAKNARIDLLATAVGPEGKKEREQLIKERDQMVLEHGRDLRKRELQSKKDALEEEKDAQSAAFDAEKDAKEAQYDSLKEAFDNYSGDIKTIESGIAAFRVSSAGGANQLILSDLDTFIVDYNAKMAQIASNNAEAKKAADLAEYNANKDAYDAAKATGNKAEMARLSTQNQQIRDLYGITTDTGKLPSFDVGGTVPGPWGAPVPILAHGGEIIINPEQQRMLFRLLDSTRPVSPAGAAKSETVIHNTFDMSVNGVTLEDRADTEILYSEREKTARRLQTMGVK
ncbi:phage tail tape measure protein, TP901 family, core region [Paenibacillus sophorae]|uniref:Phage tail tape measure protein n=1 Tax=Paenibacillus sophorae TaxID=1333845 RepID=A0A1H8L8V5_9BACL|nr:phage tail tape measure protein [Paenibacillus sophorae]QWU17396.1 phage tail tape measure protein [Paenibacillus sophorae]SEO01158.1 phage tail tape measure protein, TP901 family, core region [Paenibacillus sophorae]